MKNIYFLNFLLKSRSLSKGFTLIELLVAMIIAGIIVTAATGGLVTMLNFSRTSEIDTQRRIELNRAMDYLSEEIRMANRVESVDVTGVTNKALKITVPGTTQSYIYTVIPSTSDWISPNTINKARGNFGSTSPYNISGAIENNPLIDGITANGLVSAPSCPGGLGFFACVGADNRTVDLYLYGRLRSGGTHEAKTRVFARSN